MPPATLQAAMHRQLQRGGWKGRAARGRWLSWFGWAGLGTAAAALAVAFVMTSIVDEPAPQTVLGDDDFVRLVNNDVWERARAESNSTWLVATELPHSRLAALGLPFDPSRAGERVPAQLLMHSSGEVLAVRLER
jgi:hypothetical protein